MCRAFEETRKEGIAIGLVQGEEKAMLMIKNLMKSQNLTAKQAMDMLGLPPAEQAKYIEKLN